jgi:hypothetical protein
MKQYIMYGNSPYVKFLVTLRYRVKFPVQNAGAEAGLHVPLWHLSAEP